MPYELLADGKPVDLGERRYLLSPQDLAGLEVLPELVKAGVASLKIEGRLKAPEYVASITRVYRAALDGLTNRGAPETRRPGDEKERYELEMAFSRGLHTGWFGGIDNQRLVHARFAKKRGACVGKVTRVEHGAVRVRLEGALKAGDGIVFDAGIGDDHEEGGRIFEVQSPKLKTQSSEAVLTFMAGAVDFSRVHVGDKIWKTNDPALDRELRKTFEGDAPKFQRPICLEVHGHAGAPLTVVARDEAGHVAQAASIMPLAVAEKQPLTSDRLRDQFGRLGGTPFKLGELASRIEGDVMLPVSELNRLRREVVAQLEAQRAAPKRWALNPRDSTPKRNALPAPQKSPTPRLGGSTDAELIVLVRSMEQLETALRCGVKTVYCEFEDPKRHREAVTLFHTARGCSVAGAASIWVAPPRIFKPGEEWILKQVRSSNADGYLVRNHEHLRFFADCRKMGDFSLNVANPLAAEHFMSRFGLERLTASYDLNLVQLEVLLRSAPLEWFEVTIHQHMPMFHMEHCVFCAFLSKGKDYRDCGRPCDTHAVQLRDRVGMEHPLRADAGCRNTVFNARAQTGAEFAGRLLELGVRRFRVEFVDEPAAEVERTIARYRALLRGEITGVQLWRELKLVNQLGVTRGQMERGDTAHARR